MNREELKFRVKKIVETGISGSVLELLIIGIAEEYGMEQNLQQTDCTTQVCRCEAHTFYQWEIEENKCSTCDGVIRQIA